MLNIRPISDLRNKFTEIEKLVADGETVYLTKNGYGAMVVMGIEKYVGIAGSVEAALDFADYMAELDPRRLTHEEVFSTIREKINAKSKK